MSEHSNAVICVDIQNDFVDGGSLAVPGALQIIPNCNALAKKAVELKNNIVVTTRDWHPINHISFASTHNEPLFSTKTLSEIGKQVMWPDHCIEKTSGAKYHSSFIFQDDFTEFKKGQSNKADSYSGFGAENKKFEETGLRSYLYLNNITRVFVCGISADYCVKFTAIDSKLYADIDTYFVTDATSSVFSENDKKLYEELESYGIILVNTKEALKLMQDL